MVIVSAEKVCELLPQTNINAEFCCVSVTKLSQLSVVDFNLEKYLRQLRRRKKQLATRVLHFRIPLADEGKWHAGRSR